MRVLFLDFDGCLHRYVRAEGGTPPGWAPGRPSGRRRRLFEWVPILHWLIEPHADVFVVVYSVWRYDYADGELAHLLGGLASRYLGATPRGPRYESIRGWLQDADDVTSYRILDAAVGDLDKPAPAQLIACHPATGVSCYHVQARLRAWLGQPLAARRPATGRCPQGYECAALRRRGRLGGRYCH